MSATVAVSQDLASVAGPLLLKTIQDRVAQTGRCRLAIPGGSTPGPTLRWLFAKEPKGLWLTWVDERIDGSNLALAQACGMAAERVLPMVTGLSLKEDLSRFVLDFEAHWGGLDVALLGAGPDGHIASLFPGHVGLSHGGTALCLSDSPKPPPQRISLSLPVLQDVGLAILLARGADKAVALARAQAGDSSPLGRYKPRGDYHWILDPQAAGELP